MTFCLQGVLTALLTPFTEHTIDWPAWEASLLRQRAAGVHGVVVAGTTGEAPTLTDEEYSALIRSANLTLSGVMPVIAGVSANNLTRALALTERAQHAGTDALMVGTPYYNRPSQAGLMAYFRAIHAASSVPLFIYHNAPIRTGILLEEDTIAELASLPRMVGIKDCAPAIELFLTRTTTASDEHAAFLCTTGNDDQLLSSYAHGGVGCVSVAANLTPDIMLAIHQAWQMGHISLAQQHFTRLLPLFKALACESNPGPVKYAASYLGWCQPVMRLPMTLPSAANQARIRHLLPGYGLVPVHEQPSQPS